MLPSCSRCGTAMFPDEEFCGNCGLLSPGARRADGPGGQEGGRAQPASQPAPSDLTAPLGLGSPLGQNPPLGQNSPLGESSPPGQTAQPEQVPLSREAPQPNGQSSLIGGAYRGQAGRMPAAPTFTASQLPSSPRSAQQPPARAQYQPRPPEADGRVDPGGTGPGLTPHTAGTTYAARTRHAMTAGTAIGASSGAAGVRHAVGPAADADRTYRSINYNDIEAPSTFDPLANSRFLRNLAVRLALYTSVAGFIDVVIVVLTIATGGLRGADYLKTVFLVSALAVLAAFWVLPVPALVGQWTRLFTYRGPLAEGMLDRIRQSFGRHATPCDGLRTRMMKPGGRTRRAYVELKDGIFTGYISCFAHGNDMCVAWTFWLQVSPIRLVTMRLGRLIRSGAACSLQQTIGWESAQASFGAIHACTLDGIAAALMQADGKAPAAPSGPSDSVAAGTAATGGAAMGSTPVGMGRTPASRTSAPSIGEPTDASPLGLPGGSSR